VVSVGCWFDVIHWEEKRKEVSADLNFIFNRTKQREGCMEKGMRLAHFLY
jgi:hypothetical protein